jgi:hypothetical protein
MLLLVFKLLILPSEPEEVHRDDTNKDIGESKYDERKFAAFFFQFTWKPHQERRRGDAE